jgi:hypothetical protein
LLVSEIWYQFRSISWSLVPQLSQIAQPPLRGASMRSAIVPSVVRRKLWAKTDISSDLTETSKALDRMMLLVLPVAKK